jgi:hypothetical protein
MSKTEVYSWRVDSDLKQRLEAEAHVEKTSVGALLDRIVREWFGRGPREEDDEALQRRLHAEFLKVVGTINSGDPYGSEKVKERVRAKLMAKHERLQRDAPQRSD